MKHANGAFEFSRLGFLSGFWFLISSFLAATSGAQPATLPTTFPKSPEGAFEVHEWVIFICDPNQPQANASAMFQSTLPDFIGGRLLTAPLGKKREPGPPLLIPLPPSLRGEKNVLFLNKKSSKRLPPRNTTLK